MQRGNERKTTWNKSLQVNSNNIKRVVVVQMFPELKSSRVNSGLGEAFSKMVN